jgi:hypothetical protein
VVGAFLFGGPALARATSPGPFPAAPGCGLHSGLRPVNLDGLVDLLTYAGLKVRVSSGWCSYQSMYVCTPT